MNIVYVTFEYVSENTQGGGLATYLRNISTIMTAHGHDVTIVTLSDHDESVSCDEHTTIERVYVPPLRVLKGRAWLTELKRGRYLNRRLRRMIRSGQRIDVVQYPNTNAVGLFRTKLPTVIRISNDALLWRNSNIEGYDVDKRHECETVLDHMEDMALKKADMIFGPARVIADVISTRTGREISIIESPYIQEEVSGDIRSQYSDLIHDKKYVMTYGQLNRMKGAQVIAEAIYEILDRHRDMYYLIAGPDRGIAVHGVYSTCMEYICSCAGKYADRVVYLGCLDRNDLYPVIKGAKAVILPSRIDNMPNTCIESMYLGKVVIGTRRSGFEQLIDDGTSGILIDRDDHNALESAIDSVMSMTDEQARMMGDRAHQRILNMDPELIMEQTLDVYDRAISAKGHRAARRSRR